MTATATCPAGKVLLGGGGQATTTDADRASLPESYPSDATTWTAVGVVTANLTGGAQMTVRAYALCSQ